MFKKKISTFLLVVLLLFSTQARSNKVSPDETRVFAATTFTAVGLGVLLIAGAQSLQASHPWALVAAVSSLGIGILQGLACYCRTLLNKKDSTFTMTEKRTRDRTGPFIKLRQKTQEHHTVYEIFFSMKDPDSPSLRYKKYNLEDERLSSLKTLITPRERSELILFVDETIADLGEDGVLQAISFFVTTCSQFKNLLSAST